MISTIAIISMLILTQNSIDEKHQSDNLNKKKVVCKILDVNKLSAKRSSMEKKDIQVVILAGGLGTRLKEETEFRPKPMVPIGNKPILWHIMKLYSHYGFYKFIICLGYKGEMIKNYFLNYRAEGIDFTINTNSGKIVEHHPINDEFEVTLVDTGQNCMTGGRIARVAKYINSNTFMLTYGDGLSNVNILESLQFHQTHKKLVTLTGVKMTSRFGNLKITNNQITAFKEKTKEAEWINGGFMVCEKEFLNHISTDNNCILEQTPLKKLAKENELMVYKHNGFWQCMDTIREHQLLENLWATTAPWKIWKERIPQYAPAKKDSTQSTLDKHPIPKEYSPQ